MRCDSSPLPTGSLELARVREGFEWATTGQATCRSVGAHFAGKLVESIQGFQFTSRAFFPL